MLSKLEKKFIKDNLTQNVNSLLLKFHGKEDLNYKFIIQQISARQKIKKKLPLLYENDNIIFPPSLNLEQSSSEITSKYKRDLIKNLVDKNGVGADLTSGFGIDSIFMSENFKSYYHIEPNLKLLNISEQNYKSLNINNVKLHNTTAENFLLENNIPEFEFMYLDPSRRDKKSGKKVVLLEDYSPNIIELEEELLKISKKVLVKTSPILDFNDSLKKLKYVSEVHIVSVKNEVKEVLYLLDKDSNNNLDYDVKFTTINYLNNNRFDSLSFTYNDIKNSAANFSTPKKYLYEPNSSIMKSLAFNFISKKFNLDKLHQNSHLYTSNSLVEDFPGRVFVIEESLAYKSKDLKKIKKAHIACRNFPISVEKIRKLAKIKDGGNVYLFATTLLDNSGIVLVCRKV